MILLHLPAPNFRSIQAYPIGLLAEFGNLAVKIVDEPDTDPEPN